MVKPQPSDLELQILGVLWDAGPSSVREVLERMPDGKARAYTTILSCLQVMEKKGLVTHRREGQGYRYRPVVQKQRVLGSVVRELLRNVFGGRPSAALQYFIAAGDCSPEEIERLRRLIDEADRGPASTPGKDSDPPETNQRTAD